MLTSVCWAAHIFPFDFRMSILESASNLEPAGWSLIMGSIVIVIESAEFILLLFLLF